MAGPLTGTRIIEVAGIGPGPFCVMMLADMGAEIIRVDRASNVRPGSERRTDILGRSRRSIAIDLTKPEGVETLLRLAETADGLTEGFRPGVMERLGVGPDECLARNPKLVYGRMTGWGQEGPYASTAGHDINYISLAGALAHIGRKGEAPAPPLNLVGDNGGGGMLLAFGMACGLFESQRSGKGQVIDAAMVDGAALLMAPFYSMLASGMWKEEQGSNLLDSGAHFYDAYECADGQYVSLGSIEPQFYALLLKHTGLDNEPEFAGQMDRAQWPALKERVTAVMKTKTRAEWCAIMEGTDICFAPVLTMSEAMKHPHNIHRNTFVESAGVSRPGPAPRFSRTTPEIAGPPSIPGEHSDAILGELLGSSAAEIAALRASGAIG